MRIKGDVASVTLSEQLEHTADSISTLYKGKHHIEMENQFRSK